VQNLAGNCRFHFKIALWEASWEVLCRIWQEIANFTFKNALWQSPWELKLASLEPILASKKLPPGGD